jgi:hypothetical protein
LNRQLGERRHSAAAESLVEYSEFIDEQLDRPAVEYDVVSREQ